MTFFHRPLLRWPPRHRLHRNFISHFLFLSFLSRLLLLDKCQVEVMQLSSGAAIFAAVDGKVGKIPTRRQLHPHGCHHPWVRVLSPRRSQRPCGMDQYEPRARRMDQTMTMVGVRFCRPIRPLRKGYR
ncbi:hypothetical protein Cni_G02625 [Canna indica]|uniref:Secreted protein n=1 Tax=Canna indica TaxID=4628 RepID=A0AAQ3Q2I5_9LILI|nr:hypothetical protein Cni_G02625 [Canna indica]